MHTILIEDFTGNIYESRAIDQDHAIEMLENKYIPVYQDDVPNEYLLFPTTQICKVQVIIEASEDFEV